MSKNPALIGVIPRKDIWEKILNEHWYHIPLSSAPKHATYAEYLGFYFTKIFGKENQYKIIYYAKIRSIDIKKRIELFPDEANHARADKEYFQFHLDEIKKLAQPIPSKNWRRIVHIPSSLSKLLSAKEINDLWDTSPLEEKMYREFKKRQIDAERQYFVNVGNKKYYLDFGIFCNKGNIDVECDGERYHILPEALDKDRERNNQLTSYGWNVLRFSGKNIRSDLGNCMKIIEKTIERLGGVKGSINNFK